MKKTKALMFDTMPKSELHLHLDSALPAATVLELAARHDLFHLLPGDTEEAIAAWYVSDDFRHFLRSYAS